MERELIVHLDLEGEAVVVGRLWSRERTGRETSSFTYDPSWLRRRGAFALSPSLTLSPGPHHSARSLLRAFTDPAPDAWGRKLMMRQERACARRADARPRTLFDIDYLAGVDDRTRLGALRFKDAAGEGFIARTDRPIPPLIDLPKLLAATGRIERARETDDDLALLFAPGTSLGGARPKATVIDATGTLQVAKFPKLDDEWPVTTWEAVVLSLASRAAVTVAPWRLEIIARKPVLLLARFDRAGLAKRVPFMSAMTAVDADDHGEQRSYLDLVELIRRQGSRPDADARQLWRRLVFNILVSNTDDHLRNHAFLRDTDGWHLSPAYDMNPCPADVRPRVHALAIDDGDPSASLETALAVAARFGLAPDEARAVAAEVGAAVKAWRIAARRFKLSAAEIDRMSSAFEHADLAAATSGRKPGMRKTR